MCAHVSVSLGVHEPDHRSASNGRPQVLMAIGPIFSLSCCLSSTFIAYLQWLLGHVCCIPGSGTMARSGEHQVRRQRAPAISCSIFRA
ncbi:hypothetical protein BCR43DRAFT_175879 [Syncephalastrum racemosum]|uniref:Uncharacterized protein n=1 Tax=Syncephalastrum racemosum TaxID=13706 RepID=A0A1X2HPM0_SYNRA|nr:hypothetical protein BCR43DRAFT_175879 [Syncephalastrum racemosum]